MSLFTGNSTFPAGPGRRSSPRIREDAEAYAASLGLTPGGPGWGDAIRDFVLSGPASSAFPQTTMSDASDSQFAFRRGSAPGSSPDASARFPSRRREAPSSDSGPRVFDEELGGIRQFLGGRPGEARHDSSLGALIRESQDELRTIGPDGQPDADRHPGAGASRAAPPAARNPARPAAGRMRLPTGALSASEETSGRGPGTVSTGVNDPGGISYGSYQLSSNRGQVQAFLQSNEGTRWSRQLQGAAPGTAEFRRRWQQIAAREPEAFHNAQHDYIGRTHYTPAVTAVRETTGVDLDSMPEAVRDSAWSASVQHGSAATVLTRAVRRADARVRQGNDPVDRSSPLYQEALINEMYDGRTALLTRLINSPRTSAGDRSTYRSIIAHRYPRERAEALRRLRAEQGRAGANE